MNIPPYLHGGGVLTFINSASLKKTTNHCKRGLVTRAESAGRFGLRSSSSAGTVLCIQLHIHYNRRSNGEEVFPYGYRRLI
ncbi:hypothetical protein I7I53_11061 [Histoplasma capsulatum var. duboisii H88]|uniref:Uncharacterized protein n=1 Tax=Ajellomyces capsulatus (strain H88) TaxID=544711 RepID=A0A8A1L8F8_AJEC8|nr:hypothetical protein I7I53_11061 [Histoplasma capsulatum var. duboisii H88]